MDYDSMNNAELIAFTRTALGTCSDLEVTLAERLADAAVELDRLTAMLAVAVTR